MSRNCHVLSVTEGIAMELAQDLRRKAKQYRLLASVPTTGGRGEDRLLRELAARFEHEARTREQRLNRSEERGGKLKLG
jgi:hypothetical protein